MNPVAIESAWASVLTPAVPALSVVPGISGDVLASEVAQLIVDCGDDLEHKAGPYWRVTMRFTLDAPALTGDPGAEVLAAFEALTTLFADRDALSAQFPIGGITLNGFFVKGCSAQPVGLRWQAVMEIVAGHSAV